MGWMVRGWLIVAMLTWGVALTAGCGATDADANANANAESEAEADAAASLAVEIVNVDHDRHSTYATVRLSNRSDEPITVIDPLDGSQWGWHMPHYLFEIRDESGNPADYHLRCGVSGLWADTQWPDSYLRTLQPGEHHERRLHTGRMVTEPGRYSVTFRYRYEPDADEFTRLYELDPPAVAWRGETVSAAVDFDAEAADGSR